MNGGFKQKWCAGAWVRTLSWAWANSMGSWQHLNGSSPKSCALSVLKWLIEPGYQENRG